MDCNSTSIVSHCWYCNRLQYTMDGMDNHSYRLQWNGAWVLWRYYLLYETTIECSQNTHSIVMVVKSFKKGGFLFVNDFLLFTEIKFIFLDFYYFLLFLLFLLFFTFFILFARVYGSRSFTYFAALLRRSSSIAA